MNGANCVRNSRETELRREIFSISYVCQKLTSDIMNIFISNILIDLPVSHLTPVLRRFVHFKIWNKFKRKRAGSQDTAAIRGIFTMSIAQMLILKEIFSEAKISTYAVCLLQHYCEIV